MDTEMQRRLFTPLVRGLLVCLLGYSGLTTAAAIIEVDAPPPGNIWSNPQRVEVPAEGLTISGVIDGTRIAPALDIDFFAFEAALSSRALPVLNPAGPTISIISRFCECLSSRWRMRGGW